MISLYPTRVDDFGDADITYGDIWNDASDLTYAMIGNSSPSSDAHGFLSAYTGEEIKGLTVKFRASATGSTNQPMMVELDRASSYGMIMRFKGGASTGRASDPSFWGPGINWDMPNDGIIRDYECTVDQSMIDLAGWDTLDDIRSLLEEPDCSLYFWADGFAIGTPGFPDGEIRIYQAWLEVNAVYQPEMIYPESIEPSPWDEEILRTRGSEAGWYPENTGPSEVLTFNQASPATTWTFAHNFDTFGVRVKIFDTSDRAIDADVQFPDENTVQVNFFYPSTGYLRVFR